LYNVRTFLYLEYVLLPIGMIIFWIRFKNFRFLIYTVIATISVYFLINIKASIHYFVILIPFLFIFLVSTFSEAYKNSYKVIRYFALMISSGLIITSFLFNLGFFLLLSDRGELDGDFGRSLKSTYSDVQDALGRYKNHEDYYQIILSKYVPNSVMRGTSSFAKLLYPPEKTEKEINYLDYQLRNGETDPRIIHALVTYHTLNPTADLIRNLYIKTQSIPEYIPIYREAVTVYENTSLKKVYFGSMLPFMFEHPKHWDHIEDGADNKVIVTGDNHDFIIKIRKQKENITNIDSHTNKTQRVSIFDQDVKKTECLIDSKYCGTLFEPFQIGEYFYYIEYVPKYEYPQDQTNSIIDTMDSIIESFTIK
jgi:hypothetical protein